MLNVFFFPFVSSNISNDVFFLLNQHHRIIDQKPRCARIANPGRPCPATAAREMRIECGVNFSFPVVLRSEMDRLWESDGAATNLRVHGSRAVWKQWTIRNDKVNPVKPSQSVIWKERGNRKETLHSRSKHCTKGLEKNVKDIKSKITLGNNR